MTTYLAITRADVADYVDTLVIVYLVLIFIRILTSWVPRMPYNRFLAAFSMEEGREKAVIRHPRNPAREDPDEDQDQVDDDERVDVVGHVRAGDGEIGGHLVASTTASTAARVTSPSPFCSSAISPFSVVPPGVATRVRSAGPSYPCRAR